LRELQAEGILDDAVSRGLTVTAISREDAENAYRIRAVLEALVVEQFIEKASDADVRLLARDAETLKAAYRAGTLDRMLGAKRAFYDRICSVAENAIAFDILNRLVLRTSSLRSRSMIRPARQVQSIKEIETLVDAIQKRDVAPMSSIRRNRPWARPRRKAVWRHRSGASGPRPRPPSYHHAGRSRRDRGMAGTARIDA
jgi:DNA-binding GntR family transcriptional regulator